jgi:hypothetical protein
VQVTGTAAFNVFFWQKSGTGDQEFGCAEEFTVVVGNVVKKVADQAPNGFFWLNIFLTTPMTVPSIQFGITIQADFLITLFTM